MRRKIWEDNDVQCAILGACLNLSELRKIARQGLPRLLLGVDAVLCPVDCVSHDACQCVKEICKHTMKPCRMLRSAGLSSLVRSLDELMTTPKPQRSS